MKNLTIINAELTRKLLPMPLCIEAMAKAMVAVSASNVVLPPRLITALADPNNFFGLMPGDANELPVYGAKVVSMHPHNPSRGLPTVQGFVTLFDSDTGSPLALVDGGELTAIRTAAASGLATRLLAREDAGSCGIFGTGVQAVTHIDAMAAVRQLETVLVWGRDFTKATEFAAAQAERTGLSVRSTPDPAEAGACDLVCTVTASPEPILLGEWVKSGAHVNLAGAHSLTTREADTRLVAKSRVYVDLMESAKNEGGDVMIPIHEGDLDASHLLGEIGQVIVGELQGRTNETQITLYNSLGITTQDLYAANAVYTQASAQNLGEQVNF